jgi:hypothetical protein
MEKTASRYGGELLTYLIISGGELTRDDPPDWRLVVVQRTPHHKNYLVTKCYTGP